MVASLAIALIGAQIVESPRSRLNLDNGAVVHAERFASGGRFALAVKFRAVPESRETHGWRHLLEHLSAKGPEGAGIDQRLESSGMFLLAETGRDWTLFTVSGPNQFLPVAVDALSRVIAQRDYSDDEARAEAKVIEEELAVTDESQVAAWEAWDSVYGDSGLSPFGSIEAIKRATGADLGQLATRVFVGRGAVASVVGDVDPRPAAERLQRMLQNLPAGAAAPLPDREPVMSAVAFARTVAVPLHSVRDSDFLATLAAGFGLGSIEPGIVVSVTPSARAGLLTIGARSGSPAARLRTALATGPEVVAELGLRAARGWLQTATGTAEGRARLRATLLAEYSVFDPDKWRQDLQAGTSRDDVLKALGLIQRAVEQ